MARRIKDKETGPRKIRLDDLTTLSMLTETQSKVKQAYQSQKNLLLHGIAGTGKSFLAMYFALEEVLNPESTFKELVIVRSIVPTRDMGFLKGDEKEKIQVYEAPYIAICAELFGISNAYELLKAQGLIRFISTSFIRGITLNNSIVIVDELENLNFHELDSVITRIGQRSKLILCGDYSQSDFARTSERDGCLSFMKILKEMKMFTFIEFSVQDIVRSALVKEYIINKYKLGYS
jgi:phosphate starvation-inducible protein PhoH